MNIFIVILLLIVSVHFGMAQKKVDQCIACHKANGDKPAKLFPTDLHFAQGISCVDCHGGDASKEGMDESMNKDAGFIGIPCGDKIAEVCSNCHSDQFEKMNNSVHGKLTVKGDQKILQCTTCHSVHNIVSVKNVASPVHSNNVVQTCSKCHSDISYMRHYNPALPTDQHEKYLTSIHGQLNKKKDANAATCANCHGSHDIRVAKDVRSHVHAANLPKTCAACHSDAELMKQYKIPTDQYEKFAASIHGVALLNKGDAAAPSCNDCHGNHGAAPPGFESISKVCGTCHVFNADLFAKSPHKKAFDDLKLPECETCHSNHAIIVGTDQLIGTTSEAICSRCHTETKNPIGYWDAAQMRKTLDSLVHEEQETIKLITEAEQKGMEVSEAKFKLRDIRQAKLETRTIVHAFNLVKFTEVANKGFAVTSEVKSAGKKAIDEYYFRRWGLLAVTLIITVLAISLFVYIKRIDKKNTSK
ncbi:MAG: cytochrome c3 family protein [Bacteroidota bacterium]|nr:cytochrome c3 family protein [Bacteroidota bacterium]